MFEKIISKSTGDANRGAPPSPHTQAESHSQPDSGPVVAISPGKRNILGRDVEIQGEVRFQGDLIVDGRIEGRIISEGSLTIGEKANIKAEITCGSVIVQGKVEGNITATDRVEICALAEVSGDIKAGALSMEAGAVFVGSSAIGTPRAAPQVVQKAPAVAEPELIAELPAGSEKAPAA